VVWAHVVRELSAPPPPASPVGQPQAIVWNRHVFTSDRQLKRYLTDKGLSYTTWVSNHPSAFAVVKHELPAVVATRNFPPARTARAPKVGTASRAHAAKQHVERTARRLAVPRASAAGTSRMIWLALAALIAATALTATALAPAAVMPPLIRRVFAVRERRIYVVATATSILLTLVTSLALR